MFIMSMKKLTMELERIPTMEEIAEETGVSVLLMICYQFWDRMDGRIEVWFAMSGEFGEYLALYKNKIMSY